MSLLTNSIGGFEFIGLHGTPIYPAQTKRADDRPGADGTEFIISGKKGRPFNMISQVDAANYAAACYYLLQYQSLIDSAAVEMVQAGVSSSSLGFRVTVIDVQLNRPIFPCTGASGNRLNPPSFAFLEARWDLVAVAN